jgi:hypothetical protein
MFRTHGRPCRTDRRPQQKSYFSSTLQRRHIRHYTTFYATQSGTTIHISVTCPVKKKIFVEDEAIESDDFQTAIWINWVEYKIQKY